VYRLAAATELTGRGLEKRVRKSAVFGTGTGAELRVFFNAPDDPEVVELLARYERSCACARRPSAGFRSI
jgi:hypothetical protein